MSVSFSATFYVITLKVSALSWIAADGHKFYLSANGVWLTEHVPPSYLKFPDSKH